jgi:uncharacterized Zn-binding protein involved in type VI secretion
MQIIGWVRVGDSAACGGTVSEGLDTNTAYGQALTFRGARMQCPKMNCVIVGHVPTATMQNGREMVHHGHLTSGGCPLLSTLNDIAGVGIEDGVSTPAVVLEPGGRNWAPAAVGEDAYDEQAQLTAEGNVTLAGLPYYIETTNGRTLSGRADALGLLPRVESPGADEYVVFWGDEALTKMNGADA